MDAMEAANEALHAVTRKEGTADDLAVLDCKHPFNQCRIVRAPNAWWMVVFPVGGATPAAIWHQIVKACPFCGRALPVPGAADQPDTRHYVEGAEIWVDDAMRNLGYLPKLET